MAIRSIDLAVLTLAVLFTFCFASDKGLSQFFKNVQKQANSKRYNDFGGNPCPEPEKPFPCKSTATCISMGYVCDQNFDCEDGYDEDDEVCTAAHRPPVEDIMHFLQSEKDWMLPNLFGNKNIEKIAHGLAVSSTVNDFRRRLGMSGSESKALKTALEAVKDRDESTLEALGMPNNAYEEVMFFFNKLVRSGFDG